MQGQLDIMQTQANAMQESLTETRNMVSQSEKALEVSKIQAQMAQRAAGAAEQSIEIAQENTIIAHRAYLAIQSGTAGLAEEGGIFNLSVRNFGNTPANNVVIYAKAEVRGELPPHEFPRAASTSGGTVPPQTTISKKVVTAGKISPEEIALLNKGELTLYAWGVIAYQDIFGKSRQTKFCIRKIAGSQFAPCPVGNEAT
jgi:hypothetical protein